MGLVESVHVTQPLVSHGGYINRLVKVSYCKVTYFGSSKRASMADPAFEAEVNDIEVRHPTVIPEAGVPPPSPSCAHARRPFDASCSQANLKQSLISKAKPCVGTQKYIHILY